ncbi:MAG: electron transport complex subunit RsxG [bacterium]
MSSMREAIRNNALILGVFGLVGAMLVAATHNLTKEKILANERAALIRQIYDLIPPDALDNDILADTITVKDQRLSRNDVVVFRGRKKGEPVGLIFSPVEAPGYSSVIKLIVAIRVDGSLGGVRVLTHKETPGLGDKIEIDRSNWITVFRDKSLQNPGPERWAVKKDGGDFDQITGATISPRAIVAAVRKSLEYYNDHQQLLFGEEAP